MGKVVGCICYIDGSFNNGVYEGGRNSCFVINEGMTYNEFVRRACEGLNVIRDFITLKYTTRFSPNELINLFGEQDMQSMFAFNEDLVRVYLDRVTCHENTAFPTQSSEFGISQVCQSVPLTQERNMIGEEVPTLPVTFSYIRLLAQFTNPTIGNGIEGVLNDVILTNDEQHDEAISEDEVRDIISSPQHIRPYFTTPTNGNSIEGVLDDVILTEDGHHDETTSDVEERDIVPSPQHIPPKNSVITDYMTDQTASDSRPLLVSTLSDAITHVGQVFTSAKTFREAVYYLSVAGHFRDSRHANGWNMHS